MNAESAADQEGQRAHTYLANPNEVLNPLTCRPWIDPRPQRLIFLQALEALKIRLRLKKKTRHFFATLNLMPGANPVWVSKQLGPPSTLSNLMPTKSDWAKQRLERVGTPLLE